MLNNYFKIAWRNIWKSKLFSFINIFGLAVGMAAFWLILLFIGYEISFDNFHGNADRIFRVVQHADWKEGEMHVAITSAPFAPTLSQDYPEVEAAVRINPEGGGIISYEQNQLVVNDIFFTDSTFFDLFSFELLHGDRASALSKPQSIVLTQSLSEKLFGDAAKAVGKTVFFENHYENVVTGVISDVPSNSHLNFSALRSFPANSTSDWQAFNLYTYLLLNKNADVDNLRDKLGQFFNKHLLSEMGEGVDYALELQPLTSIHLHSSLDYEIGANGDVTTIYIFLGAAILILFIAAINYMNLTAARSSLRIKEVGVRKVIGSNKMQLVAMFLCEALLVSFLSILLAVFLAEAFVPFIREISGIEISLWQFGISRTLLLFIAILIFIGFICGVYPALFLSGFKTITSLKGQLGNVRSNIAVRKSLVIFQFVIAAIMIVGSWVIYSQLQFVRTKNLGFNKEQVLTFHLSSQENRMKVDVLKQKLLQNPLIESVSAASNPIGNNNIGSRGYFLELEDNEVPSNSHIINNLSVDASFVETLEIALIEGRNFSTKRLSDMDNAVLVNKALVEKAGWKEPLGKRMTYNLPDGKTAEVKVVGVVEDFHIYSLQHTIEPLVMHKIQPGERDNLYVRVQESDVRRALSYLEKVYQEFENAPFEFSFLDQNFSRQYESEQRQGTLLLAFTLLAVFLALLGLFGLTAFAAERRRKEVGIRKVLGASIGSLVTLLSKDFVKLVLIAFLIAMPLAWYLMKWWLQYFAYHIAIEWTVFGITGAGILFISILTVSYQAIKTALANPVDSLSEE